MYSPRNSNGVSVLEARPGMSHETSIEHSKAPVPARFVPEMSKEES